jgi:hypothetical protein
LGIEKISREQVMIAILDTSVDALNLNGRLYARSLRLGRSENYRPRKLSKLTDHAGRKMANLKAEFGMARIERIRFSGNTEISERQPKK